MTIYFKEFDVDNFDVIQSKLIPHVLSFAQNYTNTWNEIDVGPVLVAVPELKSAIKSITGKLPTKCIVFAYPIEPLDVMDAKYGKYSLHQDGNRGFSQYRLNWPILNGTSIETKFFSSSAEPKKLQLPTGQTYLGYQEDECVFETSNILTKPTIINVYAIHGLYRIGTVFPRIILSFDCGNDIKI